MLPFLPPAYVATAGDNGAYGILTAADSVKGFHTLESFAENEVEHNQKAQKLGSKELRIRASAALETFAYSPINSAKNIKISLLCIVAEDDNLCPANKSVQAAEECNGEIVRTHGGHFGGKDALEFLWEVYGLIGVADSVPRQTSICRVSSSSAKISRQSCKHGSSHSVNEF